MRIKVLLVLAVVAVLLAACNVDKPSEEQVEEVIYGVYYRDAEILKMDQCELIPALVDQGHTNIWYIKYRFVGSDTKSGMLITETGTDVKAWEPYLLKVHMCLAER
jgi:hypothetical protein